MIHELTDADLRELVKAEADYGVSIYMPVEPPGPESHQNAIRLKNMLRTAARALEEAGVKPAAAEALLAPARDLFADGPACDARQRGLALFLSRDLQRGYGTPERPEELVLIGSRFFVRPLISQLGEQRRFLVLSVSQNEVRLLRSDGHAIDEVDVPDMPRDLASALNIDEYVSSLQQHAVGGRQIVHGHGGSGKDVHKRDELLQFFHRLSGPLDRYLADRDELLIFAGVGYLFPIFREAIDYRQVVPTPIEGNPEQRSDTDLCARARELVEPRAASGRRAARTACAQRLRTDKASLELDQIVQAARHGAVESLLLAREADYWKPGDSPPGMANELLNQAALDTLGTGGAVFVLPLAEMPEQSPAAAVLRFAPSG